MNQEGGQSFVVCLWRRKLARCPRNYCNALMNQRSLGLMWFTETCRYHMRELHFHFDWSSQNWTKSCLCKPFHKDSVASPHILRAIAKSNHPVCWSLAANNYMFYIQNIILLQGDLVAYGLRHQIAPKHIEYVWSHLKVQISKKII